MTAPTVTARTASNSGAANNPVFTVSLGAPSAGELIVVFVAASQSVFVAQVNEEVSGKRWHKELIAGGSITWACVYWKVAEGSDALELRYHLSARGAALAYRISGHGSTVKVAYSAVTTSTNANPPSCTQSGSAQDTLFLAAAVIDGTVVASAAPAGYSSLTTSAAASGLGASVSGAENTGNATTENPGTFTNTSASWVGITALVGSTAISTAARITQVVAEVLSSNDDVPVASDVAIVGFFF